MENKKETFTGEASARKTFSMLGFGCFIVLTVSAVLQVLCVRIYPEWRTTWWSLWVFSFVPIYAVAVPVSLPVFRRVPVYGGADSCRERVTFGPGQMVRLFFVAIFQANVASFAGNRIMDVVSNLIGRTSVSGLSTYTQAGCLPLEILFMVILAPLIEEFVYRRLLIDRMRCYGERLAVVTSALMFGLFHGNFSQFFYTSALGLLLGYVYLKSGRLRYSAGLHIAFNLLGTIEGHALAGFPNLVDSLETMSPGQTPQLALAAACVIFQLVGTIVGLVLFCRGRRSVSFERAALELPKGSRLRTVYGNAGMILFVASCAVVIVLSFR